jgi:hypothetical protein
MHPITATLDYNSSAQSKQQNRIVQQIPLFGLILNQVSIITKVSIVMGIQRAAHMFARKKQIRQDTEQHEECENS